LAAGIQVILMHLSTSWIIGGILQNVLCILRMSFCLCISSFVKLGHCVQQL